MRFDTVANQSLTDILRRTLYIFVMTVESVTPMAQDKLACQKTGTAAQSVEDDILRMHVVGAHNGFTKL